MQKVWILERVGRWDTNDLLIGVYSSYEAAKRVKNEYEADVYSHLYYYEIQDYDVEE